MKSLHNFINESNNRFYPEDWEDCKNENDVIDAIMEALRTSGIFDSLCISIDNQLDSHIFTESKFLKEFGTRLSNDLSEYHDENY